MSERKCEKCRGEGRIADPDPRFRGWRFCDCPVGVELVGSPRSSAYTVALIPGTNPVVQVTGKPTRAQVLQALTAGWTITPEAWIAGMTEGEFTVYPAMRIGPRTTTFEVVLELRYIDRDRGTVIRDGIVVAGGFEEAMAVYRRMLDASRDTSQKAKATLPTSWEKAGFSVDPRLQERPYWLVDARGRKAGGMHPGTYTIEEAEAAAIEMTKHWPTDAPWTPMPADEWAGPLNRVAYEHSAFFRKLAQRATCNVALHPEDYRIESDD